jgi:basic membrane lipoprotein Med (substrate-binding protein (PBP1-ABC) superfamily)
LVGALAAQLTESGKIAGIYGIDIPPVKKFRNGFEQGARFINPDLDIAGVYIPDFVAPQLGAEAAEQFVADGYDVIFGAGGPTGSGGIVRAAELGAMVIGVDQDEWVTTFGQGETPGADRIVSSALKRVDQGVYDMIALLAAGEALPANSLYLMDAAVNGVGFAPAHDAVVSEEATARVQEIFTQLASGELSTGVDPVTGDLIEAAPAEEPTAEPTVEATVVPTATP